MEFWAIIRATYTVDEYELLHELEEAMRAHFERAIQLQEEDSEHEPF